LPLLPVHLFFRSKFNISDILTAKELAGEMAKKDCRLWFLTLVALLTFSAIVIAQEPEEEGVRGSFLTSRPAPTNSRTTSNPTRRPPRNPRNSGTTDSNAATNTGQPRFAGSGTKDTSGVSSGTHALGPIGLGYSFYLRESNGEPVRVDPSRDFHYKDSLRVSLEANTNGYLYVFYTENNSNPQMLFPDARLLQGDNRIEAHVPYEVPSSHEVDPAKRWFVFDDKPAVERLYIVVSRQPLPGVPRGDELLVYCKGQANCTWRPPQAAWALIQEGLNAKVNTSKSKAVGQPQTETERDATTRGLGLDTTAPAPTVVKMNVSSNAPVLVTMVDLNHK
jgi:Domain of unknown function (DUF4384)